MLFPVVRAVLVVVRVVVQNRQAALGNPHMVQWTALKVHLAQEDRVRRLLLLLARESQLMSFRM